MPSSKDRPGDPESTRGERPPADMPVFHDEDSSAETEVFLGKHLPKPIPKARESVTKMVAQRPQASPAPQVSPMPQAPPVAKAPPARLASSAPQASPVPQAPPVQQAAPVARASSR